MTFALILFSLLVLTGVIWLMDRFMLRTRRPAGVSEPWWVEYAKSFFPVILIVFVLRSFLVEPFKIPSGSMIPTLHRNQPAEARRRDGISLSGRSFGGLY